MSTQITFTPLQSAKHTFSNRIVMAPMTRSRATGNLPNALMAEYYAQRASAGLIVTEGVSPSPNGLGYARIPGIFSKEQFEAWKPVTDAVHKKNGKIFVQVMHTGRISHPHNLPAGARVFAPSSVAAKEKMWTDQEGMKDLPVPQAFTAEGIQSTKEEFVQAARNAIEAGFDGVELHGANGYLLEQFLSPVSNVRTDEYGGSIENRARFVIEVAAAVSEAIGKEHTGIRLSPYNTFNDMPHYPGIHDTYTYLAEKLNDLGILYVHLVDHSAGGGTEVPESIKRAIRGKFKNTLVLSGGYDLKRAEEDLSLGFADLVAFGKPFINNPDLVERFRYQQPLNLILDASTFYTTGGRGYTDYPVFEEATITA